MEKFKSHKNEAGRKNVAQSSENASRLRFFNAYFFRSRLADENALTQVPHTICKSGFTFCTPFVDKTVRKDFDCRTDH
jgi:hypothetical protein